MTGDRMAEMVRMIAEEIEEVTMGDIAAGEVTADSLLWSARPDVPSLGLDSLQFLELVYRVEQRAEAKLPDSLEPVMLSSVSDLAARLLGDDRSR